MAKLALVGDYNPQVLAHRAIPTALELACNATGVKLEWTWIGTGKIADATRDLAGYSAVWVVPASPYKNMVGALAAIRYARETRLPFLGTCGGFQHALIEFARNVALISDADHAETNPSGANLILTPKSCPLVEKSGDITCALGNRLHEVFQGEPTHDGFHCSYGVSAIFRARLEAAGIQFTGFDGHGDIRAFELPAHPFFIGTLFQPERSALRGRVHPLIQAFVRAIQDSH